MEGIVANLENAISAKRQAIEGHLNAIIKHQEGISNQQEAILTQQASLKSLECQLSALKNVGTENASVVMEVGEEANQEEEQIFLQNPVDMALSIPLIFEKILMELDNSSVLTSRLVSKYWDSGALKIFPKRSISKYSTRHLCLHKLVRSSDFNPIPTFDIKLARRIFLDGTCTCANDCKYNGPGCNSTKVKFLAFVKQFDTQIEIVDGKFTPYAKFFTPYFSTFLEAITENKFPNLKAINVSYHNYFTYNNDQGPATMEVGLMPQQQFNKMNLHTIDFLTHDYIFPDCYHGTLQRIIDEAPNLKRLIIGGNFYPNLSNKTKLKYLSKNDVVTKQGFSHEKLSTLLAQVKDSLEVLKLKTEIPKDSIIQSHHIVFPVMKKLKKLKILDILLHPLEQKGKSLLNSIAWKFPNLQHLDIRSYRYGDAIKELFDRLIYGYQSKNKIHTLVIYKIDCPSEVLCHFRKWFPNLQKLELFLPHLIPEGDEFDDYDDHSFKETFSGLKGINLKQFVLRIKYEYQFSDLVTALDANSEFFEKLEVLEIHAEGDEEGKMVDDLKYKYKKKIGEDGEVKKKCLSQVFCEFLESVTKNKKSVVFYGFEFSGETAFEVMPFIREKKLPIRFLDIKL